MTVGELTKKLKDYDPKSPVFLSDDDEEFLELDHKEYKAKDGTVDYDGFVLKIK